MSNYFGIKFDREQPDVSSTRGHDVMMGLLLEQYQNSPLLIQYMSAYIDELDILLKDSRDVYYGLQIEYAVGDQLDIIGRILGQSRLINLGERYFGFEGANGLVDGFAYSSSPTDGGVLFDGSSLNGDSLSDDMYRRLLLVVGYCSNRRVLNRNDLYTIVTTLCGKVPDKMKVIETDKKVVIEVGGSAISDAEAGLVTYAFAKYVKTMGVNCVVNVI